MLLLAATEPLSCSIHLRCVSLHPWGDHRRHASIVAIASCLRRDLIACIDSRVCQRRRRHFWEGRTTREDGDGLPMVIWAVWATVSISFYSLLVRKRTDFLRANMTHFFGPHCVGLGQVYREPEDQQSMRERRGESEAKEVARNSSSWSERNPPTPPLRLYVFKAPHGS